MEYDVIAFACPPSNVDEHSDDRDSWPGRRSVPLDPSERRRPAISADDAALQDRMATRARRRLSTPLRRLYDPEDITQEAWLVALESPDAIGRPGGMVLLVERAACDAARRAMRQRRGFRRTRSLDELSPNEVAARGARTAEEIEEGRTRIRDLEIAIGSLGARDRRLVRLARLEGRSVDEVAALEGCSREATKRAITRAIARLSRTLPAA